MAFTNNVFRGPGNPGSGGVRSAHAQDPHVGGGHRHRHRRPQRRGLRHQGGGHRPARREDPLRRDHLHVAARRALLLQPDHQQDHRNRHARETPGWRDRVVHARRAAGEHQVHAQLPPAAESGAHHVSRRRHRLGAAADSAGGPRHVERGRRQVGRGGSHLQPRQGHEHRFRADPQESRRALRRDIALRDHRHLVHHGVRDLGGTEGDRAAEGDRRTEPHQADRRAGAPESAVRRGRSQVHADSRRGARAEREAGGVGSGAEMERRAAAVHAGQRHHPFINLNPGKN